MNAILILSHFNQKNQVPSNQILLKVNTSQMTYSQTLPGKQNLQPFWTIHCKDFQM